MLIVNKSYTLSSPLVGIAVVVVVSLLGALYVELAALRTLLPGLTFSRVWENELLFGELLSGGLRTFAGAMVLGGLCVGIGLLLPFTRAATRYYYQLIYLAGALLFIGVMYLLVLWAGV